MKTSKFNNFDGTQKSNKKISDEKFRYPRHLKKNESLYKVKAVKKQKKYKPVQYQNKNIVFGIIIGIVLGVIFFFFERSILLSVIIFIAAAALFQLYIYFRKKLAESARRKRIEEIFPDFLSLMASNLRAGMTIDRSMLLSAREEFQPLSEEILKTGRDITAGKEIENALLDLSKRLDSSKIQKTILLLISGIRAGGNIAVLLEETSANMRERSFVEKKASSNVLMYFIFIFIAVAAGAPALFSLSGILVNTMSKILSGVPDTQMFQLPFTLSKVNISPLFVECFSLVFIISTDILASFVLGLVSKGEEKEGMKYLIPIVAISMAVFFIIRLFLAGFVSGLF